MTIIPCIARPKISRLGLARAARPSICWNEIEVGDEPAPCETQPVTLLTHLRSIHFLLTSR
jgi:hypothetical protein